MCEVHNILEHEDAELEKADRLSRAAAMRISFLVCFVRFDTEYQGKNTKFVFSTT